MSILDALNEVKKENFDPKKDGLNSGYEPIPDGTYTVSLTSVIHGVWPKSQTYYVRFSLQIVDGEQTGRTEFITPILAEKKTNGQPMPKTVIARSIKTIQKIGAMVGFDVPDKCFMGATESECYEEIQNQFAQAGVFGKLLTLTIKSSANKNDPDRPYRNYNFEMAEQPKALAVDDPFKATGDVEITDNDLPF